MPSHEARPTVALRPGPDRRVAVALRTRPHAAAVQHRPADHEPPAKPPKTPTDLVPHDIVAGRVTRGGSGPCYGLITDDDIEYALYSTAGLSLSEGTYVRIKFEPLKTQDRLRPWPSHQGPHNDRPEVS